LFCRFSTPNGSGRIRKDQEGSGRIRKDQEGFRKDHAGEDQGRIRGSRIRGGSGEDHGRIRKGPHGVTGATHQAWITHGS